MYTSCRYVCHTLTRVCKTQMTPPTHLLPDAVKLAMRVMNAAAAAAVVIDLCWIEASFPSLLPLLSCPVVPPTKSAACVDLSQLVVIAATAARLLIGY